MYTFGIKDVTKEAINDHLKRTYSTVLAIPCEDNPSWKIRSPLLGDITIITRDVTKPKGSVGTRYWTAEDIATGTIMEFTTNEDEDKTVKIHSVYSNGKTYKTGRYLKKFSQWAVVLGGMARYGKFEVTEGGAAALAVSPETVKTAELRQQEGE